MPNYLSKGWEQANQPLVPEAAIAPIQNKLDRPRDMSKAGFDWNTLSDIGGNLLHHPIETIGGFHAGALEGLRGQTSPINLAGLATMGMGGGVAEAASGLGAAAKAAPTALEGLASATPELVAATKAGLPAEMAAQGGEAAYNAVRQVPKALNSSANDAAFAKYAGKTSPSYVESLRGLMQSHP